MTHRKVGAPDGRPEIERKGPDRNSRESSGWGPDRVNPLSMLPPFSSTGRTPNMEVLDPSL